MHLAEVKLRGQKLGLQAPPVVNGEVFLGAVNSGHLKQQRIICCWSVHSVTSNGPRLKVARVMEGLDRPRKTSYWHRFNLAASVTVLGYNFMLFLWIQKQLIKFPLLPAGIALLQRGLFPASRRSLYPCFVTACGTLQQIGLLKWLGFCWEVLFLFRNNKGCGVFVCVCPEHLKDLVWAKPTNHGTAGQEEEQTASICLRLKPFPALLLEKIEGLHKQHEPPW